MRSGLWRPRSGARARQTPLRRGSLARTAAQRTAAAVATPPHAATSTAEPALQRKPGLVVAREVWFETVAIAQQRAKRRLPKSVYAALVAATEKGLTVSDNVEAFSEL